jgi:hypothetical protein
VRARSFGVDPGFALVVKYGLEAADAVTRVRTETGLPDDGHLSVAVFHRNVFHIEKII